MQTSIYTRTATGKTQDNRFGSWILTITIAVIALLSSITSTAQIGGTKNIPGDYATLALAITDLNAVGVLAGGVTLNLVAANPQTAPVGGRNVLQG